MIQGLRNIAAALTEIYLAHHYSDSRGRTWFIPDMANGHIHNAAAKLKREGFQGPRLAVFDHEIARREAARQQEMHQ